MPEGEGVVSSRPTVKIDGQDRPEMEQAVREATIIMPADGMASLELVLNDWGAVPDRGVTFAFSDLKIDSRIEIFIGRGRDRAAFKGTITAIGLRFSGRGPEIVLRAEDALLPLTRKRRSKVWEKMSVADIVRQIGSDAGLIAECDIDIRGSFQQINESDLAFLRELAWRFATGPHLEGNTLVVRRDEVAADPILLKTGDNVRRLSVRMDAARQPGKAKVLGYDLTAGEAITKAQDRLTGNVDGETAADFVNHEELFPRPHPRSGGEAEAYVRGAFDALARTFLTGEAVTDGNPDLKPGRVISLEGAGLRFNGEYRILSATHHFSSAHGYETFLKIARGWIGRQ